MVSLSLAIIVPLLSCATAVFHKDVTSANFDTLLDPSAASLMIEFYAPWCGHCKSLAPEYEKLGATFEANKEVVIAQVDADKHKNLATRFGIAAFPTLKWVQKGSSFDDIQPVDGRTAEDLLQFINKKTGMSKKLKTAQDSNVVDLTTDNFETVALDKNNHAFVGFFAPWCTHCKAIKPAWESLASLYADDKNVIVASVDCDANPDLASKYDVSGFPTLKYFGAADAEDYAGSRKLGDFVNFLNDKAGLDISSDGGVLSSGGIIKEISDYIKSYAQASTSEERSKIADTCRETVNKLDEKARTNYEYYSKVFSRIADRGIDYVKTEKDRLSKMLESTSLKGSQKKSFMRRMNVLNVFGDL